MAFPANRVFRCTACGWESKVFRGDNIIPLTICRRCNKPTLVLITKPIVPNVIDFYKALFKTIFK